VGTGTAPRSSYQRLHRQHLGALRRCHERAADQAAAVLAGHGDHAERADEQLRQLDPLQDREDGVERGLSGRRRGQVAAAVSVAKQP
jgi:hypothetical protein